MNKVESATTYKKTTVQRNPKTARIVDALRNQLLVIGYCIDSNNGESFEYWFRFLKDVEKLKKLI